MRYLQYLQFSVMQLHDVRALCREWVALEDERVAILERLSGRHVEPTRAGLVEMWTWFVRWHDAEGWEEPVDEVPLWTRRTGDPARGLPAAAYVAADGLIAQLAKTAYAHVPGAEWTVFYDKRVNDIRNHKPVLWHPEHNYHLDALTRIRGMTWALREYGRLVRTNFILNWVGYPDLRAGGLGQLNKGESANDKERRIEAHPASRAVCHRRAKVSGQ